MAGSINKVMLIGNVGKDPEIQQIPNGTKVAKFSIATTERYTAKSGEKVNKTEWHNIVIWRGLAEVVERYVKKGDSLYLEGKIQTRKWETPDGQTKYATDIVCDNMQMLGSKSQGQAAAAPAAAQSQDQGNGGMPPAPEDDLPF